MTCRDCIYEKMCNIRRERWEGIKQNPNTSYHCRCFQGKSEFAPKSEIVMEIIETAKMTQKKYINDITLNEEIRNLLSVMLDDFIGELKKKYKGEQQ